MIDFTKRGGLVLGLVIMALGGGCGADDTIVDNEGSAKLCLQQDNSVVISAWFEECRSCTHIERAECSLTVDGSTIVVSSSSERIRQEEEGVACNTGCREQFVACGEVSLPDGQYTVTHGDESYSITVPVTATAQDWPCAGALLLPEPP
ncbi:MAG: hypothetical protein R3B72_40425 [Polyangiaceae bacterium]